MTLSLRDMQQAFWQHMLRDKDSVAADGMFRSENGLGAQERLSIHADMYLERLLEALRIDFAAVRALLGSVAFESLATAYIRRHPPTHFSITQLGRHFPDFLHREGVSAAADLATLVLARLEVASEADEATVPLTALGREAAPEEACLHFVASMRIFEAQYDVSRVWHVLDNAPESLESAEVVVPHRITRFVVWRAGNAALHVAVTQEEAQALAMARHGLPLARVCEAFADLQNPEEAALRAVGSWFSDGWVREIGR